MDGKAKLACREAHGAIRPIRVAVVDDHPPVVCGLQMALNEAGFDVTACASGASELITLLDSSDCDVIVTDYCMPGDDALDGWRFISAISSAFPQLPVLVFSEFEDPFLVGSLAQRGVAGIVSKRDALHELPSAIRVLASGGRYFSPIVRAAMKRFSALPELQPFTRLTRRQMEVAGLMLCGLSVIETARLLDRRLNTISAQRAEACKRLGFNRESEMFRFAFAHDLSLAPSAGGNELR